jgi:hypothetical protein
MNTTGLINIVVDQESPAQNRIDAIRKLGTVLLQEKKQRREGAIELGERELPGQEALRQVIQRHGDQLDVRCHAAAVAAKTDSKSTLGWCNQMIRSMFEPPPPPPSELLIQIPLERFYAHTLEERVEAAGSRDVLVVNTAREIAMEITFGPYVNQMGEVTIDVLVDVEDVEVDIEEHNVFLDMILLLTSPPESLDSFRITGDGQLRLQASLPDSREIQSFLARIKKTGRTLIPLSPKAFAFRIWWEES